MNRMSLLTMAGGALALCAGTASADVLFNNFGQGDSYTVGSGATISDGAPIGTDFDQGFGFTVSGGDFFLDSLEFAMGFVTGSTNGVTITVYDSSGGVPGNELESVVVSDFGSFGNANPLAVANFSGSTVLQDGMQYFFVASSFADSWLAWNNNDQGIMGTTVFRSNLGAWSVGSGTTVAARVNGTAVPAPGALALLGLAGLAARRRRRN